MGDISTERFPRFDSDPRAELSEAALAEASRNAFPVVAGDSRKNDRLGLLAGGAIALVLGALTFSGMANRPAEERTAAAPAASAASANTVARLAATPAAMPSVMARAFFFSSSNFS